MIKTFCDKCEKEAKLYPASSFVENKKLIQPYLCENCIREINDQMPTGRTDTEWKGDLWLI